MSESLLVIKNSGSSSVESVQPAKTSVGDLVALQGVVQDQSTASSEVNIGIWESSPGRFTRNVKDKEFSHIISGVCTFTPKDGEKIELHAGDAIYFPENTEGEWEIKETLKKTYIIFK